MFDITSKKVQEKGVLKLTDAEEAPLIGDNEKQCAIEVYGPGSAAYAKAEARRNNKTVDRIKRRGKSKLSAEEQRSDQADFLADITIAFHNFTYPGEYSTPREQFHALYMDRAVGFITDQLQGYVGDWGNFSGISEMSSD
jgi:hypothetical protein